MSTGTHLRAVPRPSNRLSTVRARLNRRARVQLDPYWAGLFNELADAQRGAPEEAMLQLQHDGFSQLYSWVAEHVGDLTHRMSERYATNSGNAGYEYVRDKVEKTLNSLTQTYGFEREVLEQIASNTVFRTVPDDSERVKIYNTPNYAKDPRFQQAIQANVEATKSLGHAYAQAHSTLRVYNEVQALARDAAILLGNWYFAQTVQKLNKLRGYLSEGADNWARRALWHPPTGSEDTVYSLRSAIRKFTAQDMPGEFDATTEEDILDAFVQQFNVDPNDASVHLEHGFWTVHVHSSRRVYMVTDEYPEFEFSELTSTY